MGLLGKLAGQLAASCTQLLRNHAKYEDSVDLMDRYRKSFKGRPIILYSGKGLI
jgi:hypothetical protein